MTSRALIAVVDDDRVYSEMIRDFLEGEGFETILIQQAAIAIETIERVRPVLVLLDIRMDRAESGVAILSGLRASPATTNLPIIICTADQQFLRTRTAFIQSQNALSVAKPFDLDVLLDAIHQALGNIPDTAPLHDDGHDACS